MHLARWKQAVLHLYYAGLYPYRKWCRWHWARRGSAPVLVVMYHRVADDCATPWTISRAAFVRQIDWMHRNFDLISLDEGQRRLREGSRVPSVCITFDDGYSVNCEFALPTLLQRRIPVTYFVTSWNVIRQQAFAHDPAPERAVGPNTVDQIRALADAGVEIGGHTRTHANLGGTVDRRQLGDEVIGGAEDLAAITKRPIRYFAFPFGQRENLNPIAFELARSAGFAAVCSAYGGFNFPGGDHFHLLRFAADDDLIRLKNWCGMDPRKLWRHRAPGLQWRRADAAGGTDLGERGDCKVRNIGQASARDRILVGARSSSTTVPIRSAQGTLDDRRRG